MQQQQQCSRKRSNDFYHIEVSLWTLKERYSCISISSLAEDWAESCQASAR
jgi:hypothetical protein